MTETATQAKNSTSPIDVARSFFAAYNAHDVEGKFRPVSAATGTYGPATRNCESDD